MDIFDSPVKLGLALLMAVLAFWALGAHNRLVRLRQAARTAFEPLSAQLRERQGVARALAAASRELPLHATLPAAPAGAEGEAGVHPAARLLAATQAAEQAHGLVPPRRLRGEALLLMGQAEADLGTALEHYRLALLDYTAAEGPIPMLTELLRQLEALQQAIGVARALYHAAAHDYNVALRIFPTTLIAAAFRFLPVPEMSVGPEGR